MKALDRLMEYGPYLPLSLTENNKNKIIRLVGLLVFFVWFMPLMAICAIPMLVLMWAEMFQDVWKGDGK